jgi:hypothetical protein
LSNPASIRERTLGVLVVVAALAYLSQFVARGWVPHDEGMIGQSAERVLHGALPHIGYEEPYTGALTYLYAAVFRIGGIDLVNIRWVLFVGAAGAMWLTYALTRRELRPLAASLATSVALAWSFPNYFAGLPSWWLLLCALIALWAMVRAADTGRTRYVALAGAAAGVAMTIKQTGAYLAVAIVLWALYDGGVFTSKSRWQDHFSTALRWAAGASAIVFAAMIVGARLAAADGLFLFAPAAATAIVLFLPGRTDAASAQGRAPVAMAMIAALAAIVPVLLLLVPYVVGHHLRDFVEGALILPQKRLAFASMSMPSVWWMLLAAPFIGLAVLECRRTEPWPVAVAAAAWAAALVLPVAALWNAAAYQVIWQSARAVSAALPIVIVWQIAFGRARPRGERSVLFAAAAALAWTSLNQFPFAAPIYFCYTTPLAVVAAVVAADAAGVVRARSALPAAALLLLFALLIANRGDLHALGRFHEPVRFEATLGVPRAHLSVTAADAALYRRLIATIGARYRGGQLIAGPDCPEVYFLAGIESPSGALFDFFSGSRPDDPSPWLKGDVIIINHDPQFSPVPSPAVVAALRREFVNGEEVGRFEVRWR